MNERAISRMRNINRTGRAELKYLLKGTDDDQEAVDYALEHLPADVADMPCQAVDIEELGSGRWDVKAVYEPNSVSNSTTPPPPPEVGDSEYSFDTTGGTRHITQAIGGSAGTTVYARPVPGAASDWGGAIGVREGGVDGVDIVVPQFSYQETHQIAHATVEAGLPAIIFALTAKTNNATFKSFATGEVLFLGAQGRRRKSEDFWTIVFMFSMIPNTVQVAGDPEDEDMFITDILKGGHQAIDIEYENEEDDEAHMLIKLPFAVRIHTVYEAGDFSTLGIGT